MDGNLYASTNPGGINDNVYILDVCPLDQGADGYLTWTVEDKDQHGAMYGYGVKTWGGNSSHDGIFKHMEIGYLLNQPVTVTDGILTIGGWQKAADYKLNFVEITGVGIPIPEPATMVLLSLGGLLLRRRK